MRLQKRKDNKKPISHVRLEWSPPLEEDIRRRISVLSPGIYSSPAPRDPGQRPRPLHLPVFKNSPARPRSETASAPILPPPNSLKLNSFVSSCGHTSPSLLLLFRSLFPMLGMSNFVALILLNTDLTFTLRNRTSARDSRPSDTLPNQGMSVRW